MKIDDIIIYNNDNMNTPSVGNTLCESRNNVLESFKGLNEPEISIVVMGYNRLEKTKRCVKYLLEYTKDVDYRLFLCDNGSSDETLEYFKSVEYSNKKIVKITKNIGAAFASEIMSKITNTKYYVGLNNDVYVTKNWLSNLMKCMKSDERIGYVTPMSSNISNFQDPGLKFNSLEEMQCIAEKFNVSDPKKWMEKKRLLSITSVFKKEVFDLAGKSDYGFFHDFSDDDLTLRIGRAGYKQILCCDTFVHHDHDVFNGEDKNKEQFYKSLEQGRLNFKEKHYGIDAWIDLSNYESNLLNLGNYNIEIGTIPNVLGIDTKCGVPIFEIKNRLKLNGIYDSNLCAFTTDAKYYFDLLTVCEGSVKCDRIEFISEYYQNESFEFIILGEYLNSYSNIFKILENIIDLLTVNGQAFIKVKNTADVKTLLYMYGDKSIFHENVLIHTCIEDIVCFINQKNVKNVNVSFVNHNVSKNLTEILNKTKTSINANNSDFEKIYIDYYLLCIEK